MGRREILVTDDKVVRIDAVGWDFPFVLFRPDVILEGSILEDPNYIVRMLEVDGVMRIQANKKVGA